MRRGEEFLQQQDPSLTALARLEQMLRNTLEHKAELWTARVMLPATVVPSHPLFQAQARRLNEALTQLVEAAKAEGDIASHISTAVIVLMIRVIMREGSHGKLSTDDEGSPAGLRDSLIDILFNGIRAKPPVDANAGT